MKYRVLINTRADDDVERIAEQIKARSRDAARRWYLGLMDRIASLEDMPRAYGMARESDRFDFEIRQLNYGDYRILYTVMDDVVRVLRVRHASRQNIEPDDVDRKEDWKKPHDD